MRTPSASHWSEGNSGTMVRIRSVQVLDGFQVRLDFTDGTSRAVDLEPYLRGPVFEPLQRDAELFRSVEVDPELGTLVWKNGADMDPDVLRGVRAPAWLEQGAPG